MGYIEQTGAYGSPWCLTEEGYSWVIDRVPWSEASRQLWNNLIEEYKHANYRIFTFTYEDTKTLYELRARDLIEQSGAYGSPWQLTDFGTRNALS